MLRALISVSLLHQYVYIILPHILCFLVQAMFCAGPTSPKSVWKVHLLHQYQTPVQSQTLIKESAYNLFPKKNTNVKRKMGLISAKIWKAAGWQQPVGNRRHVTPSKENISSHSTRPEAGNGNPLLEIPTPRNPLLEFFLPYPPSKITVTDISTTTIILSLPVRYDIPFQSQCHIIIVSTVVGRQCANCVQSV